MGRKHRDDDDKGGDSIWDALMRPASMDYNGDGKIDDMDRYIELDELDRALGQGKYDYYNDPYVIAQRQEEEEEEEELEAAELEAADSDDDEYMNEVPPLDIFENIRDDDDEDDSEDYDDEYPEDSETYIPHSRNSSEKTITLSFSFHSADEDDRKKFPTTGIWQYFDGHSWKFIHALYTYDKQLKEDCGTMYDKYEDHISEILDDIYVFDKERAIADWDWLIKTFPAETLNLTNEYSFSEPFTYKLGLKVLHSLYSREQSGLLTEYIKRDYVFNYIVVQSVWEKHKFYSFSVLLQCYSQDDEFFIKCYETALKLHNDCYSKKELAETWSSFINNTDWEKISEKLHSYIKEEVKKTGDFGIPVLKRIAEKEEEIEEERREAELEAAEIEEEKRRKEQEAAEAEERRLQEEQEAAARAEREQQIKILEEMTAPLATKIISGELFGGAYMAVNQQFEYCFGSSRKTYDTVARYILGKNGKIRDISKDLQVGVISSKDIKDIFMLTSTGYDILHYNRAKYNGDMPVLESDKKRLEINKPIVEYICKYCYAAKLMQLDAYGNSKDIHYYQSGELKRAYNCWRDCEVSARDEAKAIFKDITNAGSVKVSWIEEKRLFTYAQLNYPDAEYKYSPYWSDGLCFDIYIPSLNLIIEYKQYFDDSTAPIEAERQKDEAQKFEKKRALCIGQGIKFAAWDSRTVINEANFLQFMEIYIKK